MEQPVVTLQVWDTIRGELQRMFPSDVFRTWFEGLRARCENEDTLVLTAPNEFASIWLEDNYLDLIREKVRQTAGHDMEVVLAVAPSDPQPSRFAAPPAAPSRSVDRSSNSRASRKPKIYLNPRNTFENFIVGSSNQLAHAASTAVAAEPGNAYNPLFLYGGVGMGKTHLHACHCSHHSGE